MKLIFTAYGSAYGSATGETSGHTAAFAGGKLLSSPESAACAVRIMPRLACAVKHSWGNSALHGLLPAAFGARGDHGLARLKAQLRKR
jgi:hypothetical protein